MNKTIKDRVTKVALEEGMTVISDADLVEIIREAKEVYTGDYHSRRWWNDCFTVVDCGGMLIGFNDAKTTGDDSPWDKGWEFDPNTICEVEKIEEVKTVTSYERKKEKS
jgi:hypothetical protein